MANTTFTGPVTSLNGFIGGPNINASDTQQGGKTVFTTVDASTISNGTTTLNAGDNEGLLIYVRDGAAGAPVYAFSNATNWLRCDTLLQISAT